MNRNKILGVGVNSAHSLANGLIGCWLFNEPGGQITQNMSKLRSVQSNSNVTLGMANGKLCSSYAGNGKISITNESWMNVNYLTILSKVFLANTTGYKGIVSKDDGTSNRCWDLLVEDSKLYLVVFNTSSSVYETRSGTGVLSANTWTQVGLHFDGSNVNYIKNGMLTTGTAASGTIKSGTNVINIGAQYGQYNNYMNGKIAYVYIWNRALKTTEIKTVYENPYCFLTNPTRQRNFLKQLSILNTTNFFQGW